MINLFIVPCVKDVCKYDTEKLSNLNFKFTRVDHLINADYWIDDEFIKEEN